MDARDRRERVSINRQATGMLSDSPFASQLQLQSHRCIPLCFPFPVSASYIDTRSSITLVHLVSMSTATAKKATAGKPSVKKSAPKAASGHPSWVDMIKVSIQSFGYFCMLSFLHSTYFHQVCYFPSSLSLGRADGNMSVSVRKVLRPSCIVIFDPP